MDVQFLPVARLQQAVQKEGIQLKWATDSLYTHTKTGTPKYISPENQVGWVTPGMPIFASGKEALNMWLIKIHSKAIQASLRTHSQ